MFFRMNSSRNKKESFIISIYKDTRTVFRLKDVALLVGDSNFKSLNNKVNYYVRTGKLLNPRKGIYAKPGFNPEELACIVYTPSYISMEYVLQRSGVIFQYGPVITSISYLNRRIEADNVAFQYRKIKGDILVNLIGIKRQANHVNIASAERAFLDMIYLDPNYYFDNLSPLNKSEVLKLTTIYNSKSMSARVKKIL
jgi:hypothetical protein